MSGRASPRVQRTFRCMDTTIQITVLTLQAQHSIVSADATLRCLPLCAALRSYGWQRKMYEPGSLQLIWVCTQIAALWGIEAVLVLSSRTSVGFWLGQPRPSGLPPSFCAFSREQQEASRIFQVPLEVAKLERGLPAAKPRRILREVGVYSDKSPFRFDGAIVTFGLRWVSSVDYIQLAYSSTGTRGRSKSKPRPSLQYTSSKSSAGAAKDSHSRRRSSSGKHGMDGSPYHVGGHGSKSGESTKGKPRRQKSGNKNLSMSSVSSAKKAARKLRAHKSKR